MSLNAYYFAILKEEITTVRHVCCNTLIISVTVKHQYCILKRVSSDLASIPGVYILYTVYI